MNVQTLREHMHMHSSACAHTQPRVSLYLITVRFVKISLYIFSLSHRYSDRMRWLKAPSQLFIFSSPPFFFFLILWKYLADIFHSQKLIKFNSTSLPICVSNTVLGLRTPWAHSQPTAPAAACLPGLGLSLITCCVCWADTEDELGCGPSPPLSLFCPRWSPVFPAYCTLPHPQNTVSGAAGPGSPWCLGYCMFSQQQDSVRVIRKKTTSFICIWMNEQVDF